MSDAIKGLQPEPVWRYFAEISRIPRCSGNEDNMVRYILGAAERLGLETREDQVGNVLVRKPASPGRENVRSVVLQGHMDMVGEKNKDKVHNFEKDPIELVRKENVLMANGTTLGADNGIAVAASLAIMEDPGLQHGPLEFLFTVDEESGLTGAKHLTGDFMRSMTLLNLDSEEEGVLYVGCAGGRDTSARWDVNFLPMPPRAKAVRVKVSGLKGGHSGLEIDKGRGNAIKILNRALQGMEEIGLRLGRIEGGNKRNAIPREAEADVTVPERAWKRARDFVARLEKEVQGELASTDPGLQLEILELPPGKMLRVMRKAYQKKICRTISGLPHGVIRMSPDIPGLVQTSTNVAVISKDRYGFDMATSQRSSVASEKEEICQTVADIFSLGGATVRSSSGYPGWKPNLDSQVLKTAKATYQSLYGREPEVKAIHAGLECGIIGEKYPGIDMISFGPTLEGVHSPDEKIYIDSVGRFWEYLLQLLKNIE